MVCRPNMTFSLNINLKKACFPYVFLRFPHFGSKTDFLKKLIDDSAWFCVEEAKRHCFSIENTIFAWKTNLDLNKSEQSWKQITLKGLSPGWGPYGPLWVLLDRSWRFRQLSVRLLDQFRTFRVQNWIFDEISKWFCIILAGEAQNSRYFNHKPEYLTKNPENTKKIRK